MKTNWGRSHLAILLWTFTCGVLGVISSAAATLEWSPNPASDNIAFYTVYVESASGTVANEVHDGTQFDLGGLLPNISYTIFVTATSADGIESVPSAGLPYFVAPIAAPSIIAQPASKDVLEGSLLELTVGAQGSGLLSYQWFLNDVPVAGATGAVFQVAAVTSANAGAYTVVVSNSVGSVKSAAATVRVLPHISILQQPASTSLLLGAQLILSVQASGPAPLSYQWFRGGSPIVGATAAQLQIAQVSATDAGGYTARISSVVETITSAVAQVTILQSPPTIVSQPQSAQVVLGAAASLTVSATGTDLSYQWLKNDGPIAGATSSTFTLSSVTAADEGSYRVTVSNAFGSVTSEAAVVSLMVAPVIVESPASTNLAVGGTIRLSVSATGTQPFTFAWFKNGALLPAATNDSLIISAATTNESGAYQARVSNAAGFATSAAANVAVLEAPGIVTQPIGGDLLEGSRLMLSVLARGSGVLSYQWFLNGSAINGATGASFEIASASASNAGSYSVRVSNLIGSATSAAAAVRVFPAITILQAPASTNVTSGGELRLSVQAAGPASLAYQWYRNNVKLGGKTSAELVIASATTADAGSYTVEISSIVQKVMSPAALVSITDPDPAATDCALTLATTSNGSLRISGVAPANTTYEIQRSDSLTLPRWRRIQNVSTTADGRFEVILAPGTAKTGFIRTIRR
jgi:hypothetical protein